MSTPREADAANERVPALELPTLALVVACYGAWLFLTGQYGNWPLWVLAPCVAVLLTFHSSLQHEILHGHPTRSLRFNWLLGSPPLSLWIPYDRYRTTHLVHHVNQRLTDPLDDPESNYWIPAEWAAQPAWLRLIVELESTLAGRVIIGPWWRIARFLLAEWRAFVRNDPGIRAEWLWHLAWCVPVVAWITLACGMPLWLYLVVMVVPGNGILLIRSYAEHRARDAVSERTTIVENSWILGPLFLFNNLHALHHEQPGLPWYHYNVCYRQQRARLLAANGGQVYASYFEVARRFLLRRHDQLSHPSGRAPAAQAG